MVMRLARYTYIRIYCLLFFLLASFVLLYKYMFLCTCIAVYTYIRIEVFITLHFYS